MLAIQLINATSGCRGYFSARRILVLRALVHTELVCMNAWCGKRKYGTRRQHRHKIEDDFASTGQIGIAQFPRSALKPLESQGRGFTHGHQKIIESSGRLRYLGLGT